jgi:hypothetical protein
MERMQNLTSMCRGGLNMDNEAAMELSTRYWRTIGK